MSYSHNQLYIHICMQKHNDEEMKTSGHSSLEKYTSHFIWKGSKGLLKVLLCVMWVGDWTELQHIDPHSYGHNSVSFPFSWAASTEGLGAQLLCNMVLIPASSLQLIWTSCRRGYMIIWRPFFFLQALQFRTQFNPSTVKVAPDIFDLMHLLFTQVHFFFWKLVRVGGQYTTQMINIK